MLRNRKGFTLIELLIVVVIIGILAAIALPKFSSARERAYWSAMKSDLKSLSSAQEVYYSKNFQYTTSQTTLGFTASGSVTVGGPTLAGATTSNQGWSATSTHASLGTNGCIIYNGQVTSNQTVTNMGTANRAGVPACNE